jgi:Poxvirus A32 protein
MCIYYTYKKMKLLSGNKIQALDKQVNNDPSLTPKLPFSMVLSASKGRGKSSLLINMLINTDMLAGKFNQIHIISPTNKLDSKFNILRTTEGIIKPNLPLLKLFKNKMKNQIASPVNEAPEYQTVLTEEDFYEKVSIDLLKQIIEEQKLVINTFGKSVADNILLVYDDCASQKKFWNSNQVQQLMFNSRHYKVSIIITTQSYFTIPKPLRLNTSIFALFYTANEKELRSIYEENSSNLNFKQFSSMFSKVCNSRDFNFLVVNYQNNERFRYSECYEKFIPN